ncbi:MAG: transporter substrate-binding domain-containing protein [Desulfobacteraceae bacterium]|nr:transporter substrate-binding domain-containing protein [Desulfobacteraceae bacterium]
MKISLTTLFLIFLIFFSVILSHAQDDNFVLNVGYFDFPGLTHTDENGNPAGFVNEITIKTLENTDIKYTINKYPAARLYKYLSNGKVHVFNGLSSIPIVKASSFSSKIPLFPLEMRIYHRGDKKPIVTKEELVNHSVILIRGFTYKDWGAWIRNKKNNINFYETNSHESAFEMLQRGRSEYLLNYKYIDQKVLNDIQIPGLIIKPLFRWNCYFNINKNTPNAKKILKKLEDSYEELIREGKLQQYD